MTTATAKLRALVFARAGGVCECGCLRPLGDSGQLDHAFGRARVAQAPSNCWALRVDCHAEKTANRPTGGHWLRLFGDHCKRYGFTAELEAARARWLVLKAKGFA